MSIQSNVRLAAVFCLWGATLCFATISDAQTKVPYRWRGVEINGGGFVSGLVFHPHERDLLYARTDIGGAYRWNPAAKRWIPLTDAFGADDWNFYGVESIALDPNDSNRVVLAVGTYTNDWAGNGAILRSTDRGQTWQRADLPFKNGGNEPGRSVGERLIVHPRDSKMLFFGTRRNGLWKSLDSGATWAKVASFPAPEDNGTGVFFLTFDAQNTLYAGVDSKTANLLASRDGGATWAPVSGAPQGLMPHHGVFAPDGTLYLSYSNGPGPNDITAGALWKRDRAGVWTNISPLVASDGDRFGFAGLAVDARHARTLMVSTIDRWAKGDDIFRSTDGGATWKSVKAFSKRDSSRAPYLNWGRPEADLGHWIGDLEIDPFDSDHALYVTGATIWGSDNVSALDANGISNWSVRAGGIEEVSVSALVSPPVGPHLVSGMRDIGGFVHEDLTVSPPGGMMSNPRLSRNEGLDFAGQAPAVIVRTGDNKGGYSLDGGQTWAPFAGHPASDMDQGPIAAGADGAAWVWSSNAGSAYFSRDCGANWAVCAGLPAKTSVIADRVQANLFYALDGGSGRLLRSSDGGATFSPLRTPAPAPAGSSRLVASPFAVGDLWLTGAELLHSRDGGLTWTNAGVSASGIGFGKAAPGASSSLPARSSAAGQTLAPPKPLSARPDASLPSPTNRAVPPVQPKPTAPYPAIYLSGSVAGVRGVFRSDDEGRTWARINDDAHQWGTTGQSITGDPRVYGRVFIGTNGRGILWGEPAP